MRGFAKEKVVLSICAAVIMAVAGCQEQNVSDSKQSRLVAAESIQLKKDLEQRGREIERQKKLLKKCLEEKDALQNKPEQEDNSLVKFLFEETVRLQRENEELTSKINQLEKELKLAGNRAGPKPLQNTE